MSHSPHDQARRRKLLDAQDRNIFLQWLAGGASPGLVLPEDQLEEDAPPFASPGGTAQSTPASAFQTAQSSPEDEDVSQFKTAQSSPDNQLALVSESEEAESEAESAESEAESAESEAESAESEAESAESEAESAESEAESAELALSEAESAESEAESAELALSEAESEAEEAESETEEAESETEEAESEAEEAEAESEAAEEDKEVSTNLAEKCECSKFMCSQGLNDASQFRKWSLKNHPDRGGDEDTFKQGSACGALKVYCTEEPCIKLAEQDAERAAKKAKAAAAKAEKEKLARAKAEKVAQAKAEAAKKASTKLKKSIKDAEKNPTEASLAVVDKAEAEAEAKSAEAEKAKKIAEAAAKKEAEAQKKRELEKARADSAAKNKAKAEAAAARQKEKAEKMAAAEKAALAEKEKAAKLAAAKDKALAAEKAAKEAAQKAAAKEKEAAAKEKEAAAKEKAAKDASKEASKPASEASSTESEIAKTPDIVSLQIEGRIELCKAVESWNEKSVQLLRADVKHFIDSFVDLIHRLDHTIDEMLTAQKRLRILTRDFRVQDSTTATIYLTTLSQTAKALLELVSFHGMWQNTMKPWLQNVSLDTRQPDKYPADKSNKYAGLWDQPPFDTSQESTLVANPPAAWESFLRLVREFRNQATQKYMGLLNDTYAAIASHDAVHKFQKILLQKTASSRKDSSCSVSDSKEYNDLESNRFMNVLGQMLSNDARELALKQPALALQELMTAYDATPAGKEVPITIAMFNQGDPIVIAYKRLRPSDTSGKKSFAKAFGSLKKGAQSLLQKFSKKQAPEEEPLGTSFESKDKTPSFQQKAASFFKRKPAAATEEQAAAQPAAQPAAPTKSLSRRIKDKLSSTGKLLRQEQNRLTSKSNPAFKPISGGRVSKRVSRRRISRRKTVRRVKKN